VLKVSRKTRISHASTPDCGLSATPTYVDPFAARNVNYADHLRGQGPDEVHIQQIGQRELKRAPELKAKQQAAKKREAALADKYNIKARL
jgi:hypothetical protein